MTQIKLRRDTSANFTSKNPVLGIGEPAYETDTKKLKIGDGTTAYTQLPYFSSGGGSSDITATLPIKIVDGVISLEVDGQTIQIVDGKLHANLDELGNEVNDLSGRLTSAEADILTKQDKLTAGDNITISENNVISATGGSAPTNMVTTDTAQTISGQKEFNSTILFLSTDDLLRAQQSASYRNGAGLSMGANSTSTDGGPLAPQWKIYNTSGTVDRAETIITTYNQSKLNNTNFNTANKLVKLDSDGKLPAVDGSNLTNLPSGSAPANMVTTDTTQTITGLKTFGGTDLSKIVLEGSDSLISFCENIDSPATTLIGGSFDSNGKKSINIGSADHESLSLNAKKVTDSAGNIFLTSGDKETIMGYMMPDYSTRTEVPWNTDNTAPTDGYVEVFGEGDGSTSAFVLEYTLNGVKTAVSSCYATSSNTNFRLPVICPKGTVYSARGGANGHELHFISMKGAV